MAIKYAYRKTEGRCHDMRFVPDDYIPTDGEVVVQGDELPDIETLHDQAYKDQRDKDRANDDVKAKLMEIDDRSIRAIREYIASLPDAPSYLKKHELDAQTERAKIK